MESIEGGSTMACHQNILNCSSLKSKSMQRPNLARRWPDYHGVANWRGLLDPLDSALRSELLRYGNFVQTAYTAFCSDPSSLDSLLTNTGYVVTRDLFASSAVRLPEWTARVTGWVNEPTSWVGYVAVCEDEEEIARLGRRDVVVAFRGTATCPEWVENLRVGLTRVPSPSRDPTSDTMVQTGFWSLFTSTGLGRKSLQDEVREEVNRLIELFGRREPLSITVTGHSLGAALAILTAYDIASVLHSDRRPHIATISFGGPRVGNGIFRRRVESQGVKVLRVVNPRDIVTKVPGFLAGDGDKTSVAGWLHALGMSYTDVGQELRLTSVSGGPAACHDLSMYLQLVKQLAGTCTNKAPSASR